MPQLNYALVLGSSQLSLSLQAQLVDSTGTNVGSPVVTGFKEIGAGNYLWVGQIPLGFQGGIVFSAGGLIKAFAAINPNDTVTLPASIAVDSGGNIIVSPVGLNNILIAGKPLPKAIYYACAVTAGLLPEGAGSGLESWQDWQGNPAVDFVVDRSGNRLSANYHQG